MLSSKDFGLKLLSVLIAVGLAVFVKSGSNTSQITFVVPVEIRNLPANKLVLAPATTEAEVTISGPSFLVTRIYSSPPSFRVFLPPDPGEHFRSPLKASQLNLPSSVEIIKIDPPEVEFSLDEKVTREVPIEIVSVGTVKAGHRLESLQVTPTSVQLIGAANELKDVSSIETMPVDLRGLSRPETFAAGLRVPGRYSEAVPNRVEVQVKVSIEQLEKKFRNVQIQTQPLDAAVKIAPKTVEIEVSGPRNTVLHLKEQDLAPYVTVGEQFESRAELEVKLNLPEEVALIAIEPSKVLVTKTK
ncbi:MAG: hypothetical protein K1X83_05910 [Oligoflexia bacterium]|nr:hypothetical protein [Oligoflexia bacterium]